MSKIEEKENIPVNGSGDGPPLVTKTDKSDDDGNNNTTQEKRLDYLLKQAAVYSHFVTKGSKAAAKGKRKILTSARSDRANKRQKISEQQARKAKRDEAEENVIQYDQTPDYIVGEMRDYQVSGLNWLITLRENGINGILGDEMGLGKTLQTISILGYLKNVENINGPFLVVAPLSTLPNWLAEVQRFCPSIEAFILYGRQEVRGELLTRLRNGRPRWDLCITSYETCRVEVHKFARIRWSYVALDEGHKIKNEKALVSKAMRSIKTKHRLMLTGTPLNNNLHELWALLNYLLPDIFSDSTDFDSWFDSDDCLRGNTDTVNRLHSILKPFMLRRIKAEVLKSLLPKKEIKLYIGMTNLQCDTYKKILLKEIKTVNALGEISTKQMQHIVMQLRKAANHPYLIENVEPGPPYTTDQHLVDNCGKMQVLDQLLFKLQAQGSRIVLFSQFVIVLNIIEDYLQWKGYKLLRLDGNTPIAQRFDDINAFNAPNSDIFIYIISTRAGGLGINLMTADTVIIYDSDWNPQSDSQAIDRVHRLGQKKQVHIFRMISENTIDQRIVERAEIKQRLDDTVIQKGQNAPKGEIKSMLIDAFMAVKNTAANEYEAEFDLEKILKESNEKEANTKEKLKNMTLGTSYTVYNFEGSDIRKPGPSMPIL